MLNNSPEYIDIWFALSFIGAVSVPLNVHLKGEGLKYILSHSDCSVIVMEEEYLIRISACLLEINREIKLVRRRGENISSWEIERVVNTHEKVLESAAITVPSEVGEEDVKLYIIIKSGKSITPEKVLEWCVERMAYLMIPRYIEVIDSFPKTATERIQKFKLAEQGNNRAWDREKAGYIINK